MGWASSDSSESLGIMWCWWVSGPLLHKNRWSQGHPSFSSNSPPLGSNLTARSAPPLLLSSCPPPPFPQHTWERLFAQLVVISSWFGSLYLCDQVREWMPKLFPLRAQLWLDRDWNWVKRTRLKRVKGGQQMRNKKRSKEGVRIL